MPLMEKTKNNVANLFKVNYKWRRTTPSEAAFVPLLLVLNTVTATSAITTSTAYITIPRTTFGATFHTLSRINSSTHFSIAIDATFSPPSHTISSTNFSTASSAIFNTTTHTTCSPHNIHHSNQCNLLCKIPQQSAQPSVQHLAQQLVQHSAQQ